MQIRHLLTFYNFDQLQNEDNIQLEKFFDQIHEMFF